MARKTTRQTTRKRSTGRTSTHVPARVAARRRPAARKRPRARRSRWLRFGLCLWPSARTRKRILRVYRRSPGLVQLVLGLVVLAVLALAINLAYQVFRKPTELFFPVSGALYKTPAETWDTYAPIFRRHATRTMTPDLLAALAQVEGSGNPIVRTYWRLSWSARPFEIWRPASSAVGMYQFTDGTFDEARQWCIHDHAVVADGPWNDWHSCWFNALYARVVPSHSVEMASAYLDVKVAAVLARRGAGGASLAQRQQLAAVIHLCGAGAGDTFAARRFRLAGGQRCGDHSVAEYVARVEQMRAVFRRLQ
jgi:hypothetical protein